MGLTRAPWTVIRTPVVTEKSTRLAKENTYTFLVDKLANKPEIRRAVETVYKVKVDDVRTVMVKGKRKRMKNMVTYGRKKDVKKAFVTLHEGHRLDII